MDLATLLMRVDQRRYGTLPAYMVDLQAIPSAAAQYWAGDPRGAREVGSCSPCCSAAAGLDTGSAVCCGAQ